MRPATIDENDRDIKQSSRMGLVREALRGPQSRGQNNGGRTAMAAARESREEQSKEGRRLGDRQ